MAEEYIKKEDAIQSIIAHDLVGGDARGWAEYLLEYTSTADVEPVRHGHWIEGPMCIECSCCGETFSDEIVYMCDPYRKPKRCPECGAHMDEEVNDGQDDRDR